MRTQISLTLASHLARFYIRSLRVTVPFEIPKVGIIALWHQDLAIAMKTFASQKVRVLLSPSQDGEIASRSAQGLGYEVWRGSSSHQGTAGLRALIRSHRLSPSVLGMALDGPRGPRFQIKPGTLWLGKNLELPIFPLGIALTRYFILHRSWDKARLPWPLLGKSLAYLGKPLWNPTEIELAAAMGQAQKMAEAKLKRNPHFQGNPAIPHVELHS